MSGVTLVPGLAEHFGSVENSIMFVEGARPESGGSIGFCTIGGGHEQGISTRLLTLGRNALMGACCAMALAAARPRLRAATDHRAGRTPSAGRSPGKSSVSFGRTGVASGRPPPPVGSIRSARCDGPGRIGGARRGSADPSDRGGDRGPGRARNCVRNIVVSFTADGAGLAQAISRQEPRRLAELSRARVRRC